MPPTSSDSGGRKETSFSGSADLPENTDPLRTQERGRGAEHDGRVRFQGIVSRSVFRNDENGYAVLEVEGKEEDWILTGVMPSAVPGDHVEGEGIWRLHRVYGPQIDVTSMVKKEPDDPEKIERYLASGAIKGIGLATAKKLVAVFGRETLAVLRAEPERVAGIKGIGSRKALDFSRQLQGDQAYQSLLLLLLPIGIGPSRIMRIYSMYGMQAETVIREDPFILAEKVPGIGFQTADRIARTLGLEGDHPARLRSAVLFAVQQSLVRDGNTVVFAGSIIRVLSGALDVPEEKIRQAVEALLIEGKLIRPLELPEFSGKEIPAHAGDRIALRDTVLLEKAFANRVSFLASVPLSENMRMTEEEAVSAVRAVASEEVFAPGEEQTQALVMALTHSFSVLTGGPGTGKTTIVRLLTKLLRARGERVLLAAPTGRAARRLSEVCRMDAQTIHRLLSLQVVDESFSDAAFWQDAEALDGDTLIVDECSMIDLFLFTRLLSSVVPGMRVLLIGDADQLPSIGPGQVLRDLLGASFAAHTRLERIYRQEAHKRIVTNAHRILRGEALEFDQTLESDFIFIPCDNEEAMRDGVMKLSREILPRYYQVDGIYGTQVLTAIRRGKAGVAELNRELQRFTHKGQVQGLELHGERFMTGDKVMQTKNRYDLEWSVRGSGKTGRGIMNGEMGIVQEVSFSTPGITVLFEEDRMATLTGDDLESLNLAYATTIHKSQGSEYPVEILVIPAGAPSFLTRNLLYTGVTRAKRQLFLLTRKSTLSMMLRNNDANERPGMLSDWLRYYARTR